MENSENPQEKYSEKRITIDQKDLSRRKFLQVVGIFTIGVGSPGLLSCEQGQQGCDQTGEEAGCGVVIPELEGTPPDQAAGDCLGYILVDRAKCQSCYSCMVACCLVNEGTAGFSNSRIQVSVDAFGRYPDDVSITQCRQCQDPKCVAACPTGAMLIDRDHGNIRLVDVERCIGCGRCVKACPFEPKRPLVRPDENYDGRPRSSKCDLCLNAPYHFAPEGGGIEGIRTCEAVCPMKAISFFALVPSQEGNGGYNVNLRNQKWQQLGFDVTLI